MVVRVCIDAEHSPFVTSLHFPQGIAPGENIELYIGTWNLPQNPPPKANTIVVDPLTKVVHVARTLESTGVRRASDGATEASARKRAFLVPSARINNNNNNNNNSSSSTNSNTSSGASGSNGPGRHKCGECGLFFDSIPEITVHMQKHLTAKSLPEKPSIVTLTHRPKDGSMPTKATITQDPNRKHIVEIMIPTSAAESFFSAVMDQGQQVLLKNVQPTSENRFEIKRTELLSESDHLKKIILEAIVDQADEVEPVANQPLPPPEVPRPIEASLDQPGPSGVYQATFSQQRNALEALAAEASNQLQKQQHKPQEMRPLAARPTTPTQQLAPVRMPEQQHPLHQHLHQPQLVNQLMEPQHKQVLNQNPQQQPPQLFGRRIEEPPLVQQRSPPQQERLVQQQPLPAHHQAIAVVRPQVLEQILPMVNDVIEPIEIPEPPRRPACIAPANNRRRHPDPNPLMMDGQAEIGSSSEALAASPVRSSHLEQPTSSADVDSTVRDQMPDDGGVDSTSHQERLNDEPGPSGYRGRQREAAAVHGAVSQSGQFDRGQEVNRIVNMIDYDLPDEIQEPEHSGLQ